MKVNLKQPLSPREREVYECLVRGMSNAEIADRLDVSKHTVRQHRKAVYLKMGVHSQVELMRIAGLQAAYASGVAEGVRGERRKVILETDTSLRNLQDLAHQVKTLHSPELAAELARNVIAVKKAISDLPDPDTMPVEA